VAQPESLNCVIAGSTISHNVRNEGLDCRDGAGVCHNGVCTITSENVITTPATLTPEPLPATPNPVVKHGYGFYDLSKLESLNITILEANLSSSHRDTYAVVCLKPSKEGTLADCQKTCKTALVPESSSRPVWNHHCILSVTSVNEWVLMGVWISNSDTPLLSITHSYQDMLDATLYDSTRHLALEDLKYGFNNVDNAYYLHLRTEYQFRL